MTTKKMTTITTAYLKRQEDRCKYRLNEYCLIERDPAQGLMTVGKRIALSSIKTIIRTGYRNEYFINLYNECKYDHGDGQDVTQEAIIALQEALVKYADMHLFKRYDLAYKEAYRACSRYIDGQKKRESLRVTSVQAIFDDDDSKDSIVFHTLPQWQAAINVEDITTAVALDQAKKMLKPNLKKTYELLLQGFTQREIADMTGLSKSTIYSNVEYIKKVLTRDTIKTMFK